MFGLETGLEHYCLHLDKSLCRSCRYCLGFESHDQDISTVQDVMSYKMNK